MVETRAPGPQCSVRTGLVLHGAGEGHLVSEHIIFVSQAVES